MSFKISVGERGIEEDTLSARKDFFLEFLERVNKRVIQGLGERMRKKIYSSKDNSSAL